MAARDDEIDGFRTDLGDHLDRIRSLKEVVDTAKNGAMEGGVRGTSCTIGPEFRREMHDGHTERSCGLHETSRI